jgi:acyl-CoA thioester hydrolase
MNYTFQNSTNIRVRYGETDQMGYVYYGVYAQYFEVGRVEAMRSAGMTYRSLEENGIMLPVSEFYVTYKAPAKYDDLLTVVTNITSVEGARIRFDYSLLNEEGKLLASAHTVLVFVNKESMRPTSPPKQFVDLLSKYEEQ